MKVGHLAILTECAREATFEKGEVLFHEGGPADRLFLIEHGLVALEMHEFPHGTRHIQDIGPGEVLGWSWLFPPFGWDCRATAVEAVTAVVFSGAHLLVVAEENHDFGYELMKRVAQVVIRRLQYTRRRALRSETENKAGE